MKTKILNTLRLIFKIPFLEFILVKMTQGKLQGTMITKLPPNHYQYPIGSIREVKRNGINFKLDISDIIDWFIYYGFREKSQDTMYKIVGPGKVILDIGANVGNTAMKFSQIVGEKGKVYAFEPDPKNFSRFKENLSRNSFNCLIAMNEGLGKEDGEKLLLIKDERNRGMNRIREEKLGEFEVTSKIKITSLDNFIEKKNIPIVDLIKIDVEGYEMNVLLGAQNTLLKFRPTLFIELDDNNLKEQESTAKELVKHLEENNYSMAIADTGEIVSSATDFRNCHYDIVAINKKGLHAGASMKN